MPEPDYANTAALSETLSYTFIGVHVAIAILLVWLAITVNRQGSHGAKVPASRPLVLLKAGMLATAAIVLFARSFWPTSGWDDEVDVVVGPDIALLLLAALALLAMIVAAVIPYDVERCGAVAKPAVGLIIMTAAMLVAYAVFLNGFPTCTLENHHWVNRALVFGATSGDAAGDGSCTVQARVYFGWPVLVFMSGTVAVTVVAARFGNASTLVAPALVGSAVSVLLVQTAAQTMWQALLTPPSQSSLVLETGHMWPLLVVFALLILAGAYVRAGLRTARPWLNDDTMR